MTEEQRDVSLVYGWRKIIFVAAFCRSILMHGLFLDIAFLFIYIKYALCASVFYNKIFIKRCFKYDLLLLPTLVHM